MFSLDILVWTWLTGTFTSWCTIGGLIGKFLPTAIITVYGTKTVADIVAIKNGTYSSETKYKK